MHVHCTHGLFVSSFVSIDFLYVLLGVLAQDANKITSVCRPYYCLSTVDGLFLIAKRKLVNFPPLANSATPVMVSCMIDGVICMINEIAGIIKIGFNWQ